LSDALPTHRCVLDSQAHYHRLWRSLVCGANLIRWLALTNATSDHLSGGQNRGLSLPTPSVPVLALITTALPQGQSTTPRNTKRSLAFSPLSRYSTSQSSPKTRRFPFLDNHNRLRAKAYCCLRIDPLTVTPPLRADFSRFFSSCHDSTRLLTKRTTLLPAFEWSFLCTCAASPSVFFQLGRYNNTPTIFRPSRTRLQLSSRISSQERR
jgi:hypothetical protein